eukprot:gene12469-12557_t
MGVAEAERMVELLQRLKPAHAMMLVEHDMDAVFALADRLTVMVNGEVIAHGTPPEMTTPWIDAKGIHTFYGSSHILHGIDFTVGQGETIGLMGRNGMGKSTLLKSLMGLVKPRSGSVAVAGRDMTGKPPYEVARLGIAYVPEGRGIFGNLSVVENLQMAARAGTRGQRDWTYERGLAPLIAREIWRICSLIKDSGISSVIVDKNWKHVTQITDRNIILVKGQVVFDGSSDALHAQPLLLEQYLGV